MAKILRELNTREIAAFMPLREMHRKQEVEVYEAVGEYIVRAYELTGEFPQEGGNFLVELEDRRQVAYSFDGFRSNVREH